MEKEIWKESSLPNYLISNYGRLKNKDTDEIQKLYLNSGGYYKSHGLFIHREVAFAFVDGYSDIKNQVNHKDENKLNNYFKNLEWCTRSYNETYGTKKQRESITQINTHPKRKSILCFNLNNEIICEYQSARDAARILNIPHTNIINCANNKRATAGGYIWKYKEVSNQSTCKRICKI